MDVAELIEAFKDQTAHPNHALLTQRVQELMGQGIDVSTFFATMVSSASTRDIATKKVAYAFLAKYGHTNEELCFLGINTLHQDCVDLDPTSAEQSEIVDKLYGLLSDKDAQVVVNAILALEAILVDEGGIVISRSIASHLLRRYKDWTSGQLQIVLGILCRYKPETDDEIYEIMNDVDDGLQHSSLAVQMATLRLFIWLCQDLTEIDEDVQTTIEETLLKHLESPHPDLVFASLHHLGLILEKSRKLRHTSLQHLSAIFHKPNDPIAIKLKKLSLCTLVAQFSAVSVTTFILDHLCHVASMKEMAHFQKSSRTKLDRHYICAQLDVACEAIMSIGAIGSNYGSYHLFSNLPNESSTDFANSSSDLVGSETMAPLSRSGIEETRKTVGKACLDRLFQLLVLVSDFGNEPERQKGSKSNTGAAWNHQNLAVLSLDESQVAMIQSTLLLAIEVCWQRNYEAMRHRGDNSNAKLEEGYHGIMDASQVRILGLLLLRHLDQDELDRIAKRWKPLRYRYDNPTDGSASLTASTSSLSQHRVQSYPGDISRLARISGLRMLLLEEGIQHQLIMKPLLTNNQTGVEATGVDGNDSKIAAARSTVEKRLPYVELLQQQVQEMVQSIDTAPYSPTAAGPSDRTLQTARNEQLAVLHLACHLVAFSIEHQDPTQVSQDDLLSQKLAILAQAVGRLSVSDGKPHQEQPPRVAGGGGEEDLLTLDLDTTGQDMRDATSTNTDRNVVRTKVTRDVVDQALLIHSIFLRPLLDAMPTPGISTDFLPPSATPSSFDSPFFKTEKYRQLARQKLVEQFGVQPKKTAPSPDEDDLVTPPIDIASLRNYDWRFQIGFNTLAVLK
ncbi:AP-4 complex subunit beta-1 [Linnemannia zychae]|nr:AP-4 complex subunit beta-1 [Linnemannia zychae]